jgi:prolyl-tRNA editing enzyme YbaK/EbsC (Cys-tRNA(Pro) deacylase)
MSEIVNPLTVDDVQAALSPFGLTVERLQDDTSTAPLAAAALGTTVGRIVKSLMFTAGDEPILVLVAGDRRADRRGLARELGVPKVRLAEPEAVIEIAGYAVGGVPPIGHRRPLRTLIDRALLQYDEVYAAAGAYDAIFRVTPSVLREIAHAEVTEATEEIPARTA